MPRSTEDIIYTALNPYPEKDWGYYHNKNSACTKISKDYTALWSQDEDKHEKDKDMGNKNADTLYEFTVKQEVLGMDSDNFQKVDTVKYGTYLATNSQNQSVMEEKGTGTIYTVDPMTVKEVLPYTVSIKFLGGNTNTVYHYFAEADKYEVGEMYLLQNHNGLSLVAVAKVNTESRAATKDFKPLSKVLTEKC